MHVSFPVCGELASEPCQILDDEHKPCSKTYRKKKRWRRPSAEMNISRWVDFDGMRAFNKRMSRKNITETSIKKYLQNDGRTKRRSDLPFFIKSASFSGTSSANNSATRLLCNTKHVKNRSRNVTVNSTTANVLLHVANTFNKDNHSLISASRLNAIQAAKGKRPEKIMKIWSYEIAGWGGRPAVFSFSDAGKLNKSGER